MARMVPVRRFDWRRKIARLVLNLLYGPGSYDGGFYISRWKHCSAGASGVLMHNGKVLLSLRRNVDGAGLYGLVGGHLNIEDSETFAQGLIREAHEESGIQLRAEQVTDDRIVNISIYHGMNLSYQEDLSGVTIQYLVELDDNQVSQAHDTHEASGYKLFTEAEFEQLAEAGQMAFAFETQSVRRAFKLVKEGKYAS